MICTPNLGQNKSKIWGVFMRLSKQDKINMYQLYQQNYRYSEIKKCYPIKKENFYYLMRILNRYGVSWLDKPRHKWTKEEKKSDRSSINWSWNRKKRRVRFRIISNWDVIQLDSRLSKKRLLCKNTDELIQAIHQYIQYYNNDRIKVKLRDWVLFNTESSPSCLVNKVSNF